MTDVNPELKDNRDQIDPHNADLVAGLDADAARLRTRFLSRPGAIAAYAAMEATIAAEQAAEAAQPDSGEPESAFDVMRHEVLADPEATVIYTATRAGIPLQHDQ